MQKEKSVNLFQNIPGNILSKIAQIALEIHLEEKDVIFKISSLFISKKPSFEGFFFGTLCYCIALLENKIQRNHND